MNDTLARNRLMIFLSMLGVHHPDPNIRETVSEWVADIRRGDLNFLTGRYFGTS